MSLEKNTILNLTPESKVEEWSAIINNILTKGEDIFVVGDTETTGVKELGDSKNYGKKDRILEIGLLFYKSSENDNITPLTDINGETIYFHEYINPFKEDKMVLERYNSILNIPKEVQYIHGINEAFLQGKKGLLDKYLNPTDFMLSKPAPSFMQVKPYLEKLLCVSNVKERKGNINFIAHNALFDVQFIDAEWQKTELYEERRSTPTHFQSFINIIDTLKIAQFLYNRSELKDESERRGITSKSGYSLDFMQIFYGIEIQRDLHGALLDSEILAEVYSGLISDPKYAGAPRTKEKNKGDFSIKVLGDLNEKILKLNN